MIKMCKETVKDILNEQGLWIGPGIVLMFGLAFLAGLIVLSPFRLLGYLFDWWVKDVIPEVKEDVYDEP